ncbi:hypothetical protein CHS0354_033360 [Potamilus streckersoni]|uniref:WD repeat, SAM and U-box domain-containing protein 1 n=1 Tax=Potamilus streckersoni TaxID=2493646 RepID=A0AAE0RTF5_9BIVA|nr:hypothetical protein CHS0354_033360 [Potamilus streckersoni]
MTSMDDVVASLRHTIGSHSSDVNGVSFSVSGKLATCSADKTVRLWNTDDFSELPCSPLLGHTYYVHCVTFSPYGNQLVSCSTDGKLIIWNIKNGTQVSTLQHESKSPVRVCCFSTNSRWLVTGSDDENVCLWDLEAKLLLRTYRGHEATVMGCCFTPDTNYIVSGSSIGDLRVWDARFGHGKHLLYIREGHDLGVTSCFFSPTFGSADPSAPRGGITRFLLATSGQDDLVKLWNFTAIEGSTNVSLTVRATLKGHQAPVMNCCFSPNGELLASGSIDKTVRLWDPMSNTNKGVITAVHVIEGHSRYVTCCAFSSDSSLLATGSNDRTVMIWKITSLKALSISRSSSQHQIPIAQPKSRSEVKLPIEWTVDEVCVWFKEIGLHKYESNLRSNEIDGTELLSLTDDNLKSIGIDALGHRNKILRSRDSLKNYPAVQRKTSVGNIDSHTPDEYLCPITREIMHDPVMAADGYTYERAAIQSWIDSEKDRSPMTNSPLTSKELVPNRSLKMLIQKFLNG